MSVSKISFSTKGLPREKIESTWSNVLKQVKAGGHASLDRGSSVFSSVDSCIFGTTVLNFWTADGYKYTRTLQDCAKNPNTDYSLFYIRSGTAEVHQRDRTAHVRSGDCFLVNMAEPLSHSNMMQLRFTTVHIPCELIKSLIPSPQNMTATVFSKQSPWVAALAATMRALTPKIVEQSFYTQKDLFGHICCLLSFIPNPAESQIRDDKVLMLNRFRQTLHERFYKPGISPKTMAEEHKVSTRTLHSVFARANSSFGRELLAIRMDRACHLLRDPRYNNKSIAEIGFLVGFTHPSHFTTRFTKTHGITPSAFRAQQQANYGQKFVS